MPLPLVCLLVGVIGLGALLSYALVAPSSQLLGRTLVRGDEAIPQIALTFDDGPGESTPMILDTLKEAGVRATFFLCGQNAERYPEYARRIAAEGHEIGNHTYSHPYLFWKTPGRISWEVLRAQKVIAEATGCRPKWFRPPYGVRWFGLSRILSSNGLAAVMWSVSGRDWRLPSRKIAERIVRKARAGSIVLLHDGVPLNEPGDRGETVRALGEILGALEGKYRFVTVSEMSGAASATAQ